MASDRLPAGQPQLLYGRDPNAREQAAIDHTLRLDVPLVLCCVAGGATQAPFPLADGEDAVVGAGAGADLRIVDDVHVSRVHATLSMRAGRWGIHDEGSTNGTHVAGVAVRGRWQLRHGDTVTLGERTRLLFVDRSDAAWRTPVLDTAQSHLADLTPRERDVVQTLGDAIRSDPRAGPLSNREVASRTALKVETVKTHISSAYEQLGLSTEVLDRRLRLARLGSTL